MAPTAALNAPAVDPLVGRFRKLRDQQARAGQTLDAARGQLAAVQARMNREWRIGGLTVAQSEELSGLADLVVAAETAKVAVDRQLGALVPVAPGQRGDAADPTLIRVSAPGGAHVRGRHWSPGSLLVADALTATALLGAGVASPAD
jgi:hypothetical protein